MASGNANDAPDTVVAYIELLDKVRAMSLRIDKFGSKEAVVKHLIAIDKLSRYKATQVYNEAQEYFNIDKTISKLAWGNIIADKMDLMINYSMQNVKDVSDALKVVSMLEKVGNIRQVNVPDAKELPDNFFDKPINLMSYDARIFEFGETNRKNLDKFIDTLPELTEKEKIRIKQEALLLPLNIFPNESENPRK